MLLTLPFIAAIFSLASDSSAYNIYAAVRRFYGNTANMPDDNTGVFFQASGAGFAGCTRGILVKTIEALQKTAGWLDAPDNATRQSIFEYVAREIGVAGNCDPSGILKFCNWCYIAAKGTPEIYNYFATPGSKYTIIDDIVARVSTGVSENVEAVKENVDYLVTPSSMTYARINPVIKWAILGTAAYIIIRKIFK